MAVKQAGQKRKAVPADEVQFKKHKGPAIVSTDVTELKEAKPTRKNGTEVKSILKKSEAAAKRTKNEKAPAKPQKVKKDTKTAKVEDDDDGGVKIFTGHEQKLKPKIEDDFAGFDSDSDSNDQGGAVLSTDHTDELLKGFESSEDDDEDAAARQDQDAEAGIPASPERPMPGLPASAKNAVNKSKKRSSDDSDPPIVLYIGRIPHGFYEHQMRAYFSQFGEINHLRLAHNRKTGASKHYGFIEFASGEVGRIVQRTMNGYIIFQHILEIKEVPQSRLDEFKAKGVDLWRDEGKRFKPIPWRDIHRGQLKSATREVWTERTKEEQRRRNRKAKKLKEMGYEFQMPQLRSVDEIPVRESAKSDQKATNGAEKPQPEDGTTTVDAAPDVNQDSKPIEKKSSKSTSDSGAKADKIPVTESVTVEEVATTAPQEKSAKAKKRVASVQKEKTADKSARKVRKVSASASA